jgi:hypothetical protein
MIIVMLLLLMMIIIIITITTTIIIIIFKNFLRWSLPPPPPDKLKIFNETACESAGMQVLNTSNKNDYQWAGVESPVLLTLKSHK